MMEGDLKGNFSVWEKCELETHLFISGRRRALPRVRMGALEGMTVSFHVAAWCWPEGKETSPWWRRANSCVCPHEGLKGGYPEGRRIRRLMYRWRAERPICVWVRRLVSCPWRRTSGPPLPVVPAVPLVLFSPSLGILQEISKGRSGQTRDRNRDRAAWSWRR